MNKLFGILLFFGTTVQGVQARICTSLQSGNWNTTSTWSCGSVPQAGDTLNISVGHTVSITENVGYSGAVMRVNVYGLWEFVGGGAKISMPCNSAVMIYAGGEVRSVAQGQAGNSQTITICSTVFWNGGDDPLVDGPMAWPLTVLPVEVMAFTAAQSGPGVELRWVTASESASSHFELQRTSDLMTWELVGLVPAMGNSAGQQEYSHIDDGVYQGVWYYRLVQVDQNGFRSGNLLAGIDVRPRSVPLTCVPNPVRDQHITAQLDVLVPERILVSVRDMQSGRMVNMPNYRAVGDRVNITLPELSNGMYMMHLEMGTELRSCRFLMQR